MNNILIRCYEIKGGIAIRLPELISKQANIEPGDFIKVTVHKQYDPARVVLQKEKN